GRGRGGGEGGGGERLLFLLFRALSRPCSAPTGPEHGWRPQPGREGGRAGAESETAPPPRTNKHRRLQPEPAPRPPPPAASFQPESALQPPPAPPRRDESASLRCSVLPPARRAVAAVAAVAAALGKWRPSSFSLPPFNLKRRENGASERAGERRGHGEEGQQRLRRLRLRRRRAAPPRRAARGRPPRRPRGPPGGAAAAASVMAPRRGRCFCTSICGGRGARPQLPRTCGDGTQHCGRGKPALAAAEEWP
ncbi:atherin-like, partial [Pan troglodytes]